MNKTYKCAVCDKESRFRHSKLNLYCSITCQKTAQYNELIRQWLEEGRSWKLQTPAWVKRYLREIHGEKCAVCGLSEWLNCPITLECDHIDGNSANNNVSNLRLICPNCHSQTHSFKGKNRGKGRTTRYIKRT